MNELIAWAQTQGLGAVLLLLVTYFATKRASKAEIEGWKAANEALNKENENLKLFDVKVMNDRFLAVKQQLDLVSSEQRDLSEQNSALQSQIVSISKQASSLLEVARLELKARQARRKRLEVLRDSINNELKLKTPDGVIDLGNSHVSELFFQRTMVETLLEFDQAETIALYGQLPENPAQEI